MKTPEQEADNLISEFTLILDTSDLQTCYTVDLEQETRTTAVECAIANVNNILKSIGSIYDYDREVLEPYWQAVKSELIKRSLHGL